MRDIAHQYSTMSRMNGSHPMRMVDQRDLLCTSPEKVTPRACISCTSAVSLMPGRRVATITCGALGLLFVCEAAAAGLSCAITRSASICTLCTCPARSSVRNWLYGTCCGFCCPAPVSWMNQRSEEHTSELQSPVHL